MEKISLFLLYWEDVQSRYFGVFWYVLKCPGNHILFDQLKGFLK